MKLWIPPWAKWWCRRCQMVRHGPCTSLCPAPDLRTLRERRLSFEAFERQCALEPMDVVA